LNNWIKRESKKLNYQKKKPLYCNSFGESYLDLFL
jgi:hypothetical protein